MMTLTSSLSHARRRARVGAYTGLIKVLQTSLLLLTGLAGYVSARAPLTGAALPGLVGSLFLTISGSTALNMVCDADIDARMTRTARRPLPTGRVSRNGALAIGLIFVSAGSGWALALAPAYGAVVLAGLFFDVVVYTIWLKRRTPWSIVWGGIAGGMPILAGRTLGTGEIDGVGLLLALAIVLWIPTHILTYTLKHADDYCLAGVPVLANTHGTGMVRRIMAVSTGAAIVAMWYAAAQIGLPPVHLNAAAAIGLALLTWTLLGVLRPSARRDYALYKLASFYMLGSMVLIVLGLA